MKCVMRKRPASRLQGFSAADFLVSNEVFLSKSLRVPEQASFCARTPSLRHHVRTLPTHQPAQRRPALEGALPAVQVPETAAPAAPAARRRRGRDARQGAGEDRRDAASRRAVEGRDADRGDDAAQGQVHDVRPQGEAVSQGDSQAAQVDESVAEAKSSWILDRRKGQHGR